MWVVSVAHLALVCLARPLFSRIGGFCTSPVGFGSFLPSLPCPGPPLSTLPPQLCHRAFFASFSSADPKFRFLATDPHAAARLALAFVPFGSWAPPGFSPRRRQWAFAYPPAGAALCDQSPFLAFFVPLSLVRRPLACPFLLVSLISPDYFRKCSGHPLDLCSTRPRWALPACGFLFSSLSLSPPPRRRKASDAICF